jgi:hypothetical protein
MCDDKRAVSKIAGISTCRKKLKCHMKRMGKGSMEFKTYVTKRRIKDVEAGTGI